MSRYLVRMTLLVLMVLSLFVVIACSSSGATSAPTATPPAALNQSPNLSTPVGPIDPAATVDKGLNLDELVALAYNPAEGSLLKANSQGLFRWKASSDWEKMTLPVEARLSGVVVNPDAPANLYIAGPGLGVIHSDDSGASWQAINNGLPSLEVTALVIHSFRRDTLYTWLNNEGLYRTEDGGATWKKVPDVPIADPKVQGLIHSTLSGSMNTGWLYAATPSGTYLSMD
jgi:photosystem II stability/assembly factor-like uncharacterized protein